MPAITYTNTGFKIHPTASQFFTEGPDSGSIVNLDFNVSLYESQSSFVNLSGRNYFYKIFDPEACVLEQNCLKGRIINAATQSSGVYDIEYHTGSAESPLIPALSGTIQLSGVPNFNQAYNFSQIEEYSFAHGTYTNGTGSYQISGSNILSNTVYFRYINVCALDFESAPSPNYALHVANPAYDVPSTTNTLQVNFILDENSTIDSIQDSFGNGFEGVTSVEVTVNSDTSNLDYNSFIVQAGGNVRTYLMDAGESVDFDLNWISNQSMNINYVFDTTDALSTLSPQGTNILGNATITSTLFGTTTKNFSQGVVYQNPFQISIAASPNLDQDYKLTIRLGHRNNLQQNQ